MIVKNYPNSISFKGDLCPSPHGNFTFSDLPLVRREGRTDHVTVSWKYQVDMILYANWISSTTIWMKAFTKDYVFPSYCGLATLWMNIEQDDHPIFGVKMTR